METITITVNNVNRPPVLTAIGYRSVIEGDTLFFTVSASDVDGVSRWRPCSWPPRPRGQLPRTG